MPQFTQDDLKTAAERLLGWHPDPVPRFRLLRDVLHLPPSCAEYREAENSLQTSRWVILLQQSQQPDGAWGRFHTQDTTLKQPFATTEAAITTALDSGLDCTSPILAKVQTVILRYMSSEICWPDPPEKHDNPLGWYAHVPQVSAGVLAQIDPRHPRLGDFWQLWAEALRVSFQSGVYDRRKEIEVLNQLFKCQMKKPIPFHVKYPLLILSAANRRLPEDLERQVLDYVMHSPAGIYYVYDQTISDPPAVDSRRFWGWIQAHRLLARFPAWKEAAEDAVNWIWAQRGADGLWDASSGVSRKPFSCFPLSESWRRIENRKIDASVVMLDLLSRCFAAS